MASLYLSRQPSQDESSVDEILEEEEIEEVDDYEEEEILEEEVLDEIVVDEDEEQALEEIVPDPVPAQPSKPVEDHDYSEKALKDEKVSDDRYDDVEMARDDSADVVRRGMTDKFKKRMIAGIGLIFCCIFVLIIIIIALVLAGGSGSGDGGNADKEKGVSGGGGGAGNTSTDAPTISPSEAPSFAPTIEPDEYVLNAGPFFVPTFEGALAMTEKIAAAGAPDFDGGVVQTYILRDDEFESLEGVPNVNKGRFGAALDAEMISGKPTLLVGAPDALVGGGLFAQEYGSAYVFELIDEEWTQKGSPIAPTEGALKVGGKFGAAVDISNSTSFRLIVGAPSTGVAGGKIMAGRAYAFRFNGDWMADGNFDGENANDGFGSSVSISGDGESIVIGAPNAERGYIHHYRKDGSQWIKLKEEGLDIGDAFGSVVTFLDHQGSRFAVASPNANGGDGTVMVFERKEDGFLGQVGNTIVGQPGDGLGSNGMFGVDDEIILGTESGKIRRYRFGRFGEWVESSVVIDAQESILVVSSPDTFDSIVAGTDSGNILIFKMKDEDSAL